MRILGPFTKEDIPKWEMFRERKKECDTTIAQIEADLNSRKMKKYREQLLD